MADRALHFPDSIERNVYASKEAGTFNVYAPRWVLSNTRPRGIKIPNFDKWPSAQREALLRTMAERATKHQEATIKIEFATLKAFADHAKDSEEFSESGIDVESFILWAASDYATEQKSLIKRLISNAQELGYEGAFDEDLFAVAKEFSGKRTRFHPDRFESSRSFTDSERKQLFYQLARESHLGNIPGTLRMLATLTLVTGKRPVQLANSKFMDFSREEISLGRNDKRDVIIYNAPVAKQRGQTFRSKFNITPISSSFDLWNDLERQRAAQIERINRLLGIELNEEQSLLLPIVLPQRDQHLIQRVTEGRHLYDRDLEEFLRSNYLHVNPEVVTKYITGLDRFVTVLSDHTGRPLKINAKRFRHTRATNLALNGASIEEIADALDHADNRSSRAYVDNLPIRAVKIGSQVEETLGVLAKKFAGLHIEDSDQVINLYTKNGAHNVGVCGMESFCKENYPIACYECQLFNANPFGNHAAVQEHVETKLEEAKKIGDSRLIENWNTILLAVLERRYQADKQRIQILNETPEILSLGNEDASDE
jgi:integrase